MTDTPLNELQYELDDLIFGRETPFTVESVEFGQNDIRNQDVNRSRSDGRRFGRDYKSGRTITFNLNVLSQSPLDDLDVIWAKWDAADIRQDPGQVYSLRWNRGGRTRRVYGRPREFLPVTGSDKRGWIPATATFATQGPYFYDDAQQQITVGFVPPTGSGYTVPYTVPLTFSGTNPSQGSFTIDSPAPLRTPIELQINGPITNPEVTIDNNLTIRLRRSIESDDYAVVDPIAMTVISRFGENWAGDLDPNSTYLSGLEVGTGQHVAVLTGTDETASASVHVRWRDVRASY